MAAFAAWGKPFEDDRSGLEDQADDWRTPCDRLAKTLSGPGLEVPLNIQIKKLGLVLHAICEGLLEKRHDGTVHHVMKRGAVKAFLI